MPVFGILPCTSPLSLPNKVASWHTEPMKVGFWDNLKSKQRFLYKFPHSLVHLSIHPFTHPYIHPSNLSMGMGITLDTGNDENKIPALTSSQYIREDNHHLIISFVIFYYMNRSWIFIALCEFNPLSLNNRDNKLSFIEEVIPQVWHTYSTSLCQLQEDDVTTSISQRGELRLRVCKLPTVAIWLRPPQKSPVALVLLLLHPVINTAGTGHGTQASLSFLQINSAS